MRKDGSPRRTPFLDFTVRKVYDAYRYRAARLSVLCPVLGDFDMTNQAQALTALRWRWFRRVCALRDAGWPPVRSWGAATFAFNCPPVGVKTGTTARTCKRTAVCPFCHARQHVLAPFRRMERILYGDRANATHAAPLLRPDLAVVWFRHYATAMPDVPWNPDADLHVRVAVALQFAAASRRREVDDFGAEYGAVTTRILVFGRGLRVRRAGVLLVPVDKAVAGVPRYESVGGKAGVYRASKKSLYDAFVRGMAYPPVLLTADAALSVRVLGMTPRSRISSWYGARGDGRRVREGS